MALKLVLLSGETITVPEAVVAEGGAAIAHFHREAHEVLGLGAQYEENQRRAAIYTDLRQTLTEDEARMALDPLPPTDTTAPRAGEE